MIRITTILLTVALNLIMSAHTAQAGTSTSIKISFLPFNITAPGTYVMTGNLTLPAGNLAGINVITNVSGPVVIDLKGYTITGPGGAQYPSNGGESFGVFIGHFISGNFTPPMPESMNSYPITIRNGTISHCTSGIYVGARRDVTINNIAFIEPADLSTGANIIGVDLERSVFATVNNCKFSGIPFPANSDNNGATAGIYDFQSTGGNSYNNNTL